jgi:hypothetical protein
MNDEFEERIRKETALAYSRYYPRFGLKGLGDTTKISVSKPGVAARYFPVHVYEHYRQM